VTKTELIVDEFNKKIEETEAKYQIMPIMKKGRSLSVDIEDDYSYFERHEDDDDDLPDPTDIHMHPLRKKKRRYLRVNSQSRNERHAKKVRELRPLTQSRVEKMKELDISVKLCDMGNACYIEKHYSDII